MNLTKCLLAGLCISAMTASAGAWPQENSFETGAFIGDWTAPQGNIVAGITGVSPKPIPAEADTKVLQLDTNGGTWTNTVGASFAAAPVYVDMLAKFVPSEELPALDGTVKMALAMTNGLLCVTKNNGSGGNTWVGTATAIDTSLWYRVTVKLEFVDPDVKANVKINGTDVTVDGTTFTITDNDGYANLIGLGFSGTGFIDEVVVTDVNPFGSTTVAFGGGPNQVDSQALQIWKTDHNGGAAEQVDQYNAFLMNVDPEGTGSPKLVVNSIDVGGTTVLTVKAEYAEAPLLRDLGTTLNAPINVWGKVDLATGEWVRIGSDLSFTPGTYQFFTVTVGPVDVPPGGVIL